MVNLFIAVVINNLEAAKLEHQVEADRRGGHQDVFAAIGDLRERLDHLERLVREPADGPDGARDGRRRGERASRER